MSLFRDKKVISWAMYDWANSAFATTVMAGFFPVFFKEYWSAGLSAAQSTFQLGMANSMSSLIVVFLAPLLGAIADRSGVRKRFLLLFAAVGVAATGYLYFIEKGAWQAAALVFVLAELGFSCSLIFYDALLVYTGKPDQWDYISALGYALGYLGGGLLFAVNVLMVTHPGLFGLEGASTAVRASFLMVAVWWAVFSVPLALYVTEPRPAAGERAAGAVRTGLRQLRSTFAKIRSFRVVFLFLIGYWFYIDGVDTVILMAVDYGLSIGLPSQSLILALLITQFVGFPAAILFGKIGTRIGAKKGIFIGLAVYLCVTVWGYTMQHAIEFYILAVAVGLVQGGVQSLSRSFFAAIIPADQSGEFFGFYNLLGKFAAIVGPALMGWTAVLWGEPRYSILSVAVLFIAGGGALYFVDEKEGRRLAAEHRAS